MQLILAVYLNIYLCIGKRDSNLELVVFVTIWVIEN